VDETDPKRRLRWQCRRGLLELDLLLSRFLEERYVALDPGGQEVFRDLLQQPDPVLLRWFQGQEQPPDRFRELVKKIV
jgi:antitoxin CptB